MRTLSFCDDINPDFCVADQMWWKRSIFNVAPAWAYSQVVNYCNNGNFKWFQNNSSAFQKSIWISLRDGYDSFANLAESTALSRLSQDSLDNIDNKTLGVVRPGFAGFILDSMMPILTYKYLPKDIADLKKEKVFKPKLFDWNYVGKRDFTNMSDAQFIEGRILGYLAISCGAFCGKTLAKKYQKSIKVACAKGGFAVMRLMTKIGLMDQGFYDFFAEFSDQIKEGLKGILCDMSDPNLVMAREMFFSLLIQLRILSQAEVAEFDFALQSGEKIEESTINDFAEKIVTKISDNFVNQFFGWIGSSAAWIGTNWAMKKYGPFYPKVKAKVQSALASA